jgi:hypothetical protein
MQTGRKEKKEAKIRRGGKDESVKEEREFGMPS